MICLGGVGLPSPKPLGEIWEKFCCIFGCDAWTRTPLGWLPFLERTKLGNDVSMPWLEKDAIPILT